MTALSWLNDRTDERVITALLRRCGICAAKAGDDCRHPWETKEKLNRIVHLSRAQHHMDREK